MSFAVLLEYCINMGFNFNDNSIVTIEDLKEFLNSLDLKVIEDEEDPNKYYVDISYT